MKQVRIRKRGGRALAVGALLLALVPGGASAQVAETVEITLEVTPNGVVNSTSGAAVVRGAIECSHDATVHLDTQVTQQQGDNQIEGWDYVQIDCTTESQLWTLAADPGDGSFAKGLVDATVYASAQSPSSGSDEETATIRLQEVCNVVGTPEGEELRGFGGNDTICGLGGDDVIYGRGGKDRLVGGPGLDVIRGGDGSDTLIGGPGEGANRLNGGPGSDRCKPETRRDVLRSCETKF